MEIVLSSSAKQEVKAATKYYEDEVEGLGKAFIGTLRAGLLHIRNHPNASVILKDDHRRHLLPRFPFGIIYRIDGNTIFVAAVMHLRRKPDYWHSNPDA
jgi:plasmid stabilization system protein ParE